MASTSAGRRLPRIAILLALVLLIPVTSLAAVTGSSAITAWSDRLAAVSVRNDIAEPSALLEARALLVKEGVASIAVAHAAESGLSTQQLTKLTGIDYLSAQQRARPAIDGNTALHEYPSLRADLAKLDQLRTNIDGGRATYGSVFTFFIGFTADVDAIWTRQLTNLRRDVMASSRGTGVLAELITVLPTAYAVLTTDVRRTAYANDLLRPAGSPSSIQSLIESNAAYEADAAVVVDRLGPKAAAAWRKMQRDPSLARFDAFIHQSIDAALTGRPLPAAGNLAEHALIFAAAAKWLDDLQGVVEGASLDVRDVAMSEAQAATHRFELDVAIFLLSVLFAAAAAVLMTRSVVRPLRQLSNTARRVAEGDFTPPVIARTGPREVAETISAVDDMTAVLAALESFTVTLAEDPTADSLDTPLPGRTGHALQTTLDRLRESVRDAQRQRVRLHEVATHDGLTGLLNRAAALDAVHRELAQARRDNATVTLLFIDLDGLKAINDTHGHKVGDEAIRLVAKALKAASRASDLVARLGGDEFLISVGSDTHDTIGDAQSLAERLHRAVAGCSLEVDLLSLPLRCSIGIAVSGAEDEVESLIHKADQALYLAKKRGRNQTCWHLGATVPSARLSTQAAANRTTGQR